jgi:hypothetical protein
MRQPRIDGILRNGEVAGLIAPPKYGKSWLTYYIEGCVAAGLDVFDQFPCTPCRVLHIDLELHAETLASRVPRVWQAMGLNPEDYRDAIDFVPLRGKLMDLNAITYAIEKLESNDYGLVVLDPLYRALPAGVKENENEGITQLFNRIDNLVQQLDAAWLHVHHASKGDQSGKSVTDVGSGAGAQSRAPDAHLIMRQHEEPGCMVFEGVVRSFPPIRPLVLRWDFPLWHVDTDLNPNAIKGRGTKGEERQKEKDKEGIMEIIDVIRKHGPSSASKVKRETGMSKERAERLLVAAWKAEHLTREKTVVKGNECYVYSLKPEDVSDCNITTLPPHPDT